MTIDESLDIVGVDPTIRAAWLAELRAPHRHYHTLDHIAAIVRLYGGDVPEIHAAAWLHDIRYDAARHDNEELSAQIAAVDLAGTSIDIAEVQRIIIDTKHHAGGDPTLDLFCDLDLAILSAERDAYAAYAEAIRREYAFVPEAAWRAGRAAVLRTFDTRRIYKTARFASREAQAHDNLRWEIGALGE